MGNRDNSMRAERVAEAEAMVARLKQFLAETARETTNPAYREHFENELQAWERLRRQLS